MKVLGHFVSLWDIFGLEGIRKFSLLGYILGLGALGQFGLKSQTKKIDKIDKDFELYQVFMCQTVLIFPKIYIVTKKIETFWSRDIRTL